ncbi:NnrS family protein [Aromatoleum sp.]|uniref:NnrS family protein n=1 Tax=Aromatoleum sp. TaxID=2307007 RepID=UPI002FCA9A27
MLTRPRPWSLGHPLWMCGFRSFFLFTILWAPLIVLLWAAFLNWGIPLPDVAGGPFIWHAHELLFGFGLAAVAGFVLTAIPEFTSSPRIRPHAVRLLASCWLAGRVAFWLSGAVGAAAVVVSAVAHLALLGGLIFMLASRIWRHPERRHLSFLWALIVLTILVAGFYRDALTEGHPGRWLSATLGVFMILIVIAMSRISMRIVNAAIDAFREKGGGAGVEYRARPPRRNLAIVCIALYTGVEFFAPGAPIGGWLALAAAAALFNLLNDWHVGRPLFRRWPLMLYAVYVLMATGYGLMGLALLTDGVAFSAGRHLLTVGALGLGIFTVICIAGRNHAGYPLDERPWIPVAAALLVGAALLRAVGGWGGGHALAWMTAASLAWTLSFVLCAHYLGKLFARPRTDGGGGCEGPRSSA